MSGRPEALEDWLSHPGRIWNRIPDDIRGQIVELALEEAELSPRELAVRFSDSRGYFVSEATQSTCKRRRQTPSVKRSESLVAPKRKYIGR